MNKKFKQNILDNKFVYLLIFTEVILTYIACSGTLYMSMNIVNKAILSFGLLLLSCQHICYTYERVFQNACYFIENYKWISQGVKLCVP